MTDLQRLYLQSCMDVGAPADKKVYKKLGENKADKFFVSMKEIIEYEKGAEDGNR